MTVADLIAALQRLPIDSTLWNVSIKCAGDTFADDPLDEDVALDFSLGSPDLDALWQSGDREGAEAMAREARNQSGQDHPRYLQPVTLCDGRSGTIVECYDATNFYIDYGSYGEDITEDDISS